MENSVNRSSSFTLEEVTEKYYSLKIQHENVCRQFDSAQQELHDMKRNQQCVSELKDHLTSEIEALQKNENKIKAEWTLKYKQLQDELEQLREEKWKESENYSNTIESLENQISKFKQNPVVTMVEKPVSQLDNTKVVEEIRMFEEEIATLKDSNLELKNTLTETVAMNEMVIREVESLKEQVECLRSNLSAKKEELITTTDMLHSAQEDLCSASVEIQQLKSQTTSFAAKGNSLFAEVDDKRQEMLKSMSQMKDKVYQLNRELVSRQAKIDALLCEKKTLWEEYSGQSDHHDAALHKAYERRITELEKQTYQLSREIARWFDKNIDPNASEAAQWLSGVLEHYRKENSRLTNDLTAASVNNLSIEQKLRELQRQIVTWRTKVMESRATATELETKLQLAERTLQNVTNFNTTNMDETKLVKPVADLDQSKADPNNSTLREGFREINVSKIKNESVAKENVRPGILTSGGNENKVPKKASFM